MDAHLNPPADSPVIDEFLRQVRGEYYRLNLTSLWVAAGQDPDMEPQRWISLSKAVGAARTKVLQRPGGPAEADGLTAALYAIELEDSIEERYYRVFRRKYKGPDAAADAMIDDPCSSTAMLSLCDVMYMHDGGPWRAGRILMGMVADRARELGVNAIRLETILARAWRAMTNERHPVAYVIQR